MAIPNNMSDLSTTANSNSPAGTETPGQGDDFLRSIQAILRTTNFKGADIASATTTDIGAATGEFVDVTGTTTITGLGIISAGIRRVVRFTGILTLTHNATSLILPGGANITTANGAVAQFRSLGSGNWQCTGYMKADGTSVVSPFPVTDTTAIVKGSSDATKLVRIEADGITTATTRVWTAQDKDITVAGLSDTGFRIFSISASCAANALTATIISGDNYGYRSTTAAVGSSSNVGLAANASVVIPSSATLGTVNGVQARIALLAINNAGSIEAAVCNLGGTNILDETGTINTTTISASATSANVIYSTTGRTGVAYRVVGYIEITEATAGTWSSQPTTVQPAGGQSLVNKGISIVPVVTQATTSGTSIDFTGIPSWVKRITVMLSGVSTNGTANIIFQIGPTTVPETSGYLGASSLLSSTTTTNANFTAGFGLNASASANVLHGTFVLTLLDLASSRWVASGTLSLSNSAASVITSGSKTITGALGVVRMTTSTGADTFDAGNASIFYE